MASQGNTSVWNGLVKVKLTCDLWGCVKKKVSHNLIHVRNFCEVEKANIAKLKNQLLENQDASKSIGVLDVFGLLHFSL